MENSKIFEILGLNENASSKEIWEAFKRQPTKVRMNLIAQLQKWVEENKKPHN